MDEPDDLDLLLEELIEEDPLFGWRLYAAICLSQAALYHVRKLMD